MTVFRVYWKIVYKNLASISITFIVFLILCFLFVETDPKQSYEFEPTKTTVTIINKDADNELLNGLTEYLTNYANFKDIEEKHIEDALYYRDIYLAIIIPEGFTDSFLAGEEARIIEKSVPDVANTVAIKLAINNYFNTVRLYLNHTDESIDEIIPDVITDLEKSINVEKTSKEEQRPVEAAYYYNYLSYILISVFITIVGTVMLSFRQKRIRQRITVSPVQQTKLNFQLILGHLVMALIITAVMCGLSFAFYPKGMAGDRGSCSSSTLSAYRLRRYRWPMRLLSSFARKRCLEPLRILGRWEHVSSVEPSFRRVSCQKGCSRSQEFSRIITMYGTMILLGFLTT